MNVTVKDYLTYLRNWDYPELLGTEGMRRLENIERAYGSRTTQETILEVRLDDDAQGCDYSIRFDTGEKAVKDFWYELDYDCYADGVTLNPCLFFDASSIVPGEDNHAAYETVLPRLADRQQLEPLMPMLERCVAKLSGRCGKLFQLGVMSGRGEADRIRLFTEDLSREALLSYLTELHWNGNRTELDGCLKCWERYSDRKKFILDFDVCQNGISDKIGINFNTRSKRRNAVAAWLTALEAEGLCLREKSAGILRWIDCFPSHTPFIQNDISHFKIPFQDSSPLGAKAYLRQGCNCYMPWFQAYRTPLLMNLELTSKCPLRCPQCYCDLSSGRNLPLEQALYWIDEAANNQVQIVNLSGGETLCYPHLIEVVQACSTRKMAPNIAISGAGFDQNALERLRAVGVADICVSLNGSTKEINDKTRDGYELAIHALELLRDAHYPRTCINWVMHSWNADDFGQMIALAERYKVSVLAVMVFKPDASHQLPSLPSEEQMHMVAQQIRHHLGAVSIQVEECFSQMRALVCQTFWGNRNIGVAKGCGAGRDGISINLDGNITPCRHLEYPEKTRSIAEYWNKSPLLTQLREVEAHPEAPCKGCRYVAHCLPCMAVNAKLKGTLSKGDETCPLGKSHPSEEEIVLVDGYDRAIGAAHKLEVHQKGLLHRAFSVFLYHDNQILIQQRAVGKYHSAGLWANTCCSHQRKGETLAEAAHRRLQQEVGIDCKLRELTSFQYRTVFSNGLTEYEIDHLFIGEYDGPFRVDPEEAQAMHFVDMDELTADITSHPQNYASWFLTAFPIVREELRRSDT